MSVCGLDPRLVPNLDQLAVAHESVVANGPARGCRAIDLRVWGGLDVRLLPDRGCDVGAAWFRGTPVAWTSVVGETAPLGDLAGDAWLAGFGGGLVTTCGLRNAGAPSERHGLHGAFSHRAARVESVRRHVDGDRLALTVVARVREGDALGGCLELERTVTTWTGAGHLRIVDVTRNRSRTEQAAPLLYHVNVGPPLWAPGATVEVDRHAGVLPRDATAAAHAGDWASAPSVRDGGECVYEHRLAAGGDAEGMGRVRVRQPATGVELELRWDVAAQPRLHQWVHPAPGVYALALEPANCSVRGRAHDRAEGRMPTLAPGAARRTRLEIRLADRR